MSAHKSVDYADILFYPQYLDSKISFSIVWNGTLKDFVQRLMYKILIRRHDTGLICAYISKVVTLFFFFS